MKPKLDLMRDGITMRQCPQELRSAISKAAETWQSFTELSDSTKDQLAMHDAQFGSGYERKFSGERGSSDFKENFDVTRESLGSFMPRSNHETVRSLLLASETLIGLLEPEVGRFGNYIEKEYDIPGFGEKATLSQKNYFVRFLHYPPAAEGTMIGEPHTDHSGFTFHLYESNPGCERLSLDSGQWLDMPVSEGEMAAFGGMQLQLETSSKLTALCHRITADDETARYGRKAIVCFVKLENTPTYDRTAHGRLQEKTAGFNYDMSTDIFRGLFRKNKN